MCNENQACLGLAKAGLGVVFIPGQQTNYAMDGLTTLDIEDPTPVLEVAVAWRADDPSLYLDIFRELPGIET